MRSQNTLLTQQPNWRLLTRMAHITGWVHNINHRTPVLLINFHILQGELVTSPLSRFCLVHLRWCHVCQALHTWSSVIKETWKNASMSLHPPTEGLEETVFSFWRVWCLDVTHERTTDLFLEAWEGNHPKGDREGAERTWISGDRFGPISATLTPEDRLHFVATWVGYLLLLNKLLQHSEA